MSLRIAVDFDGTIVTHKYPEIGKEMNFAFQTLKALQKNGHRLILWTFRTGDQLDEAVAYCKKNGIEFYAVNKNYPEEIWETDMGRKIDADIFIDDKNLGGFPGWGRVYQLIHPEENPTTNMERSALKELGSSIGSKIKSIFGRT
jgi:hypothetical protein